MMPLMHHLSTCAYLTAAFEVFLIYSGGQHEVGVHAETEAGNYDAQAQHQQDHSPVQKSTVKHASFSIVVQYIVTIVLKSLYKF